MGLGADGGGAGEWAKKSVGTVAVVLKRARRSAGFGGGDPPGGGQRDGLADVEGIIWQRLHIFKRCPAGGGSGDGRLGPSAKQVEAARRRTGPGFWGGTGLPVEELELLGYQLSAEPHDRMVDVEKLLEGDVLRGLEPLPELLDEALGEPGSVAPVTG